MLFYDLGSILVSMCRLILSYRCLSGYGTGGVERKGKRKAGKKEGEVEGRLGIDDIERGNRTD